MKIHRACILFFLLFVGANQLSGEVRGLWVVRYALLEEKPVETILERARQLNITDVYLQVWALGQPYYETTVAGNSKNKVLSGEQLHRFIEEAQRHNIRVHAWINTLFVWANGQPSDQNHPFLARRKSLLKTAHQSTPPSYSRLKKEGFVGYFIDPGDNVYLGLLGKLIQELLHDYRFDGIHLDYFRYPGARYSFSQSGIDDVILDYFVVRENMYRNPDRFLSKFDSAVVSYVDRRYRSYLRSRLDDLLQKITKHVKNGFPAAQLSIAVKPDLYKARHYYYQDWQKWLDENWCDQVVIMNYIPDRLRFRKYLNQALATGNSSRIIVGISTYNQRASMVKSKIEHVKQLNFAGYSLFSFNHLHQNAEYLSIITQPALYND